jgi:tRNA-modifying protein YgfZ
MNSTLTGLSHIAIDGDDALPWLQNLITADIESQPVATALGAALLTPQGKILFDFIVLKDADQKLILECRTEVAAALVQRLTLYKLRAKLTIGVPQAVLIAVNDQSGTWRDVRFGVPVWRSVNSNEDGSRLDYDLARVAHGVAESGMDYTLGDVFPHDVNLDQIGGVGFRKGCYVGQEVVSRMQHRGTARRRLVVAEAAENLPVSGTPVLVGDREIGTLGTVVGNKALAIIRLDKAADAEMPVTAGGVELVFALPLGATFLLTPETETNA